MNIISFQIKCKGAGCPVREKCAKFDGDPIYRYDGNIQYAREPFIIDDDGKFSCHLFSGDEIEILKYNLKKRL